MGFTRQDARFPFKDVILKGLLIFSGRVRIGGKVGRDVWALSSTLTETG
jgi:hypothetical protein